MRILLTLILLLASTAPAQAVDISPGDTDTIEPIPFLERYKPTYFLLGKPITKVQVSFKVEVLHNVPLYFGYTQLMMWDLFKTSAPFRDQNYNPELFYRFKIETPREKNLDIGLEHESNGKSDPDSRGWNRVYARFFEKRRWKDRQLWWSVRGWVPYGMSDGESKLLPRRRGLYELQIGMSDFFNKLFDVNELVIRIYGGGSTRINPLQGGQEITYREKSTSRKFLLPLYLQIFHGYGENQLDADEKRWGFRAGVGF